MSEKNDEEAFGAGAADDADAQKEEHQQGEEEEEERWPNDRKQFRKDFVPFEKLRGNYPALEFYFSDSNLPRDKVFTRDGGTRPGRVMDLKLILKFQRMRDILNDSGGSNNPEVVEAVNC